MTNLSRIIDEFGALKARMADLEEQEKALKAALADLAPGDYEGELFRLSISASERETPDKELGAAIKAAVKAYRATLSRQYLVAHTVVTPIRTHKVTARNGKAVAA